MKYRVALSKDDVRYHLVIIHDRQVTMKLQIKISGTRHTVKQSSGVANTYNSIRSQNKSPMKGTRNIAHIQIKIPKIGR